MHQLVRNNLIKHLKDAKNISSGIVLLEGGVEESFYDTDGEPIFRYLYLGMLGLASVLF